MYHGSPAERAELRRTVMRLEDDGGDDAGKSSPKNGDVKTKMSPRKAANTSRKDATDKHAEIPSQTSVRTSGRLKRKANVEEDSEQDEGDAGDEDDEDYKDEESSGAVDADVSMADGATSSISVPITPHSSDSDTEPEISSFPVVITTYEMIIKDRIHLARYDWGYIVVDEGHRLKNLDCKLMQEIKKYPSAGRMILTGTPLHVSLSGVPSLLDANERCVQNNLAELWSLLNFILPDIFEDLEAFQEWCVLATLRSIWMFTLFFLLSGSTWAQCNAISPRSVHLK